MTDPSQLPAFALPAVQVVNTAALERDAKSIVVFFDQRGAEFCKARLQAIQEILPELKTAGYQVYGISTDGDLGKTAEWAAEIAVEFPLLSDVGGVVSERFGLLNSLNGRSERALAIIEDGAVRHRETVDYTDVPEAVLQLVR